MPAIKRLTTKAYTQDDRHELLLNGEFHLGSAVAEICLITMHTLTYGSGVPLMYPIASIALLLIVFDTKLKLKYMWPLPKRYDITCTELFLRVVKAMALVHVLFGTWMHSYFRMAGQITSALSSPSCGDIKVVVACKRPDIDLQLPTLNVVVVISQSMVISCRVSVDGRAKNNVVVLEQFTPPRHSIFGVHTQAIE
jgi:hypothetical protein